MKLKEIETCERTKLELFLNKVRLPHSFKKLGFIILILSFIGVTGFKFIDDLPTWSIQTLKHAMLLGLLIMSLSKEKIEDELIETLRSKSYSLAFIIGVGYTMLQPLANFIVDFFLEEQLVVGTTSHIQVLLFMLLIQVGFFEVLKRNR
ncbi:hypothetical protein [Bizionia sp.]|uniref:hypothetical protein n=1 Tax=Bizionia sp. TaxID=1954480 RepID=UPI003A8D7992